MYLKLGPGSSVGIATAYRLDGPGIEFNIPLLNVGRGGLSGRGQGKNWGWYFVWIPDTYYPTGQYDPPSSTGPRKGRWRSYGSLPTCSTTDYNPVGAFLSRILWDELGVRRIADHADTLTLARTWICSDAPTSVQGIEERQPEWRDQPECMARPGSPFSTCLMPQSRSSFYLLFLCSYSVHWRLPNMHDDKWIIKGRFI